MSDTSFQQIFISPNGDSWRRIGPNALQRRYKYSEVWEDQVLRVDESARWHCKGELFPIGSHADRADYHLPPWQEKTQMPNENTPTLETLQERIQTLECALKLTINNFEELTTGTLPTTVMRETLRTNRKYLQRTLDGETQSSDQPAPAEIPKDAPEPQTSEDAVKALSMYADSFLRESVEAIASRTSEALTEKDRARVLQGLLNAIASLSRQNAQLVLENIHFQDTADQMRGDEMLLRCSLDFIQAKVPENNTSMEQLRITTANMLIKALRHRLEPSQKTDASDEDLLTDVKQPNETRLRAALRLVIRALATSLRQ